MQNLFKSCALLFILQLVAVGSQAQDVELDSLIKETAPVVQISGMVVTGDSLSPLPFATVFRMRDLRGTMTDANGFFSIPALEGDTITVSSVGYVAQAFSVPKDLLIPRMNVVQPLGRDTVAIDQAFIYPWPTKERFREEFLELQLTADAFTIGQQRLDAAEIYDRLMEVGRDGSEVYSYTMQQQAKQGYYQGQLAPMDIFNPIAWAKFIEAIRNGSLKR
mgnify:FL=1|tara:strand:+ start:158 stop:817 length:660 start_codon:yes stop_codon:yes gene_type:complete